jgi:hypothetical protein
MFNKFALVPLVVVVLVFLMLANSPVQGERIILIPWGSILRHKTLQPPYISQWNEFTDWEYNDSSWPTGPAPFGAIDSTFCLTPAATPWTLPDSSIVVRIKVNLPPDSDSLRIEVRADRNVGWFVNGWAGDSWFGPNCPYGSTGDYLTFIRELGQVLTGDNLIVLSSISVIPSPDYRYRHFDCQVSAYIPITPVESTTWGYIKALLGK